MPLTFKEAHSLIHGARPHWYLWSEATSESIFGAGSVGPGFLGRGWRVMSFPSGISLRSVEMVIFSLPGSSLKHRFSGRTAGSGDAD